MQYILSTMDMLFEGNVLKKKFFRDVQDAKKRSKTLAQQIFTCLDGELYQHDEVSSRNTFLTLYLTALVLKKAVLTSGFTLVVDVQYKAQELCSF